MISRNRRASGLEEKKKKTFGEMMRQNPDLMWATVRPYKIHSCIRSCEINDQ
jgi:hypothetical protein